MDKAKIAAIVSVVLTAALGLLAVFGYHVVVVQPVAERVVAPENPGVVLEVEAPSRAVGDTNFTNVVAVDVVAAGDVSAGGDVIATGGITATAVSATGAVSAGTFLGMGAPAAITVTNGATITPGGSYQRLQAGGPVGTGAIAGCATAGRVTYLENVSAVTITITDTGTLVLGGNAALGQYDGLALLGDGTRCVEVGKSDN